MKERCNYCHQDENGFLADLLSFRINEGLQMTFNIDVSSFDGGGVSIEDTPRMCPYGSFAKFSYCPVCGRKLVD